MTISLNGEGVNARGAQTIEELVERYQLSRQTILIEHNGHALHRQEWPECSLAEGDCIEFICVVAGG